MPGRGPPHGRTRRATNTTERYQRAQHRPNHIIRAAATGGTHPRGILKHASFLQRRPTLLRLRSSFRPVYG